MSALQFRDDPGLTDAVERALDQAALRDIASALVLDLAGMRRSAWRPDENIYPASVVKVPIMVEAFRQIEAGILREQEPVTVTASNQTTTWGGDTPFTAGTVVPVIDLVDRMITHSDNVATNQLMDVLRRERVTDSMRLLGLRTFLLGRKLSGSEPLIEDPEMVGRNRLPPSEIGLLLALIALDRVPQAARQRDILRRCMHGEKLVRGLRTGDVFMHKTGETSEESHDAGILLTADGKRYVVVLYTRPAPKADDSDADHVDPQMAEWMRSVRQQL